MHIHIHTNTLVSVFCSLSSSVCFSSPNSEHIKTCTHLLTNRNSKLSSHKGMWKSTKYLVIFVVRFSRTARNLCVSRSVQIKLIIPSHTLHFSQQGFFWEKTNWVNILFFSISHARFHLLSDSISIFIFCLQKIVKFSLIRNNPSCKFKMCNLLIQDPKNWLKTAEC